jgi:hypothetical protein
MFTESDSTAILWFSPEKPVFWNSTTIAGLGCSQFGTSYFELVTLSLVSALDGS